jgi:Domain of unknown function (DUF4124)
MIGHRFWVWVVGCVLVAGAGTIAAQTVDKDVQTVYRWTDAGGVVHFADTPPLGTQAEERHLAVPSTEQATQPEPMPEASLEQPSAALSEVPPGSPARVLVLSRKTTRRGASALQVVGEVENFGGADATDLSVAVTANEPDKARPCLRQQFKVSPSTLHPGERGRFTADVDHPCLYGNPAIDVAPAWK